MPVAAKSTPSKARRTTTRKPRATKKATTKSVASVATVTSTKYTQPVVNKVTETPVKSRPETTLITWDSYVADAKVRWEIHQWETKQLWEDCKWVYNNTKPIVTKVVDYCKTSYNRAFNEGN
jgi:hypothetical protein